MVKETLNSVFDNLRERATNPFLGTLILVWLVKNWKLVYSLFHFHQGFTLESRLAYIENHFSKVSFVCNALIVIGISLAVLVVTYILLSLSRLLTDLYDRMIIPGISKLTDKSSVVLKSDYKKLREEVRNLEERLGTERANRISAETERDTAEKKLKDSVVQSSVNTESGLGSGESAKEMIATPNEEKQSKVATKDGNINTEEIKIKNWKNKSYSSTQTEGTVSFDYSNNNGLYRIGEGELLFELKWSKAGKSNIHIYTDPSSIKTVAVAKGVLDIKSITKASQYDGSSRTRTPAINDIIILYNINGYYAAIKIIDIKDDTRGDANDEITFEYMIQENGSDNFRD